MAGGTLSLPFVHANLNKRSIILDLQQPQDQERFRALATQADVVVSTEGTATWATRGVDLTRLATDFPGLVWTALTPFGLSGPYSTYVGTTSSSRPWGASWYIQGDDTRPPCVSPYEQGVHLASLHAAFGTLSALWERRASGCGQVVEVSAQEVVAQIYYASVRYAYGKDILRRTGARNPQPANGYYRCQDGHIFLSLFQPHQWDRLVELMQDPLLMQPEFRERAYQYAHAEMSWRSTSSTMPSVLIAGRSPKRCNDAVSLRRHCRPWPTWRRMCISPPGTSSWTSSSHPGEACAARGRSFVPQPRRCAYGDQHRDLGEHQTEVLGTAAAPAHTVPDGLQPRRHTAVAAHRDSYPGPQPGLGWALRHTLSRRFGAEVIKVESGKFPDGRRPNDAAFAEINRNKRYITLNFQMPEGRELLKRLVAVSDVVVENFSPRVMVQYELDYQHLRAMRSDLIMVSMPGFGQSGPHSAFVSYGGPLMAYTGMALLWGHADSPIEGHSKIAYPDYTAAGTCALAVTAALHHRASTGQGQHIEIAQVETTAAAMEVAFLDYFTRAR